MYYNTFVKKLTILVTANVTAAQQPPKNIDKQQKYLGVRAWGWIPKKGWFITNKTHISIREKRRKTAAKNYSAKIIYSYWKILTRVSVDNAKIEEWNFLVLLNSTKEKYSLNSMMPLSSDRRRGSWYWWCQQYWYANFIALVVQFFPQDRQRIENNNTKNLCSFIHRGHEKRVVPSFRINSHFSFT